MDTPAAHAGIAAEERGQAWAIADALLCMLGLRTPTVSVVLSEGGSGGALALALADRVLALENAVYTVAPPETCAAILYRDAGQRARAAAALRPGVDTAHRIGLVDELIPEPPPGAHAHAPLVIAAIRGAVIRNLDELGEVPVDELVAAAAPALPGCRRLTAQAASNAASRSGSMPTRERLAVTTCVHSGWSVSHDQVSCTVSRAERQVRPERSASEESQL